MAWLKGLAGKAEDFLNQIDQNAAVVLTMQKDKEENQNNQLTEVTWDKPTPVNSAGVKTSTNITTSADVAKSNSSASHSSVNSRGLNSVRSSPNLSSFTPIRSATKQKKDDDLIEFLNSSTKRHSIPDNVQVTVEGHRDVNTNSPSITSRKASPLQVDIVNETLSMSSHSAASSRRATPDREVSTNQTQSNRLSDELKTENELLKNELRSFNNEMSLLLQRAKSAEKECSSLQLQVSKLQAAKTQTCLSLKDKEDYAARLEMELKVTKQELLTAVQLSKSLEAANSKFSQDLANSSGYQDEVLMSLKQELSEKEEQRSLEQLKHNQEVTSVRNTVTSLEAENVRLRNQIDELQQSVNESVEEVATLRGRLERSRAEMAEVRAESDAYRTRAQRILHEKERLISELRGGTAVSDSSDGCAEELRALREEAAQLAARLHAARDELQEAELRTEAATSGHARLQAGLKQEEAKRRAAEEECRAQAEDLQSVREELQRRLALMASTLSDRERELSRLRQQLSRPPVPPPALLGAELEARLAALTHTLVEKQAALEAASTERNAYRLQCEKMRERVNDTDDAKARVPSFLEMSPFDNGVARRVKRAYGNLDAASIRTGNFLRRYPLARILMLSYMVLLHLWVMLVLFTYTPEVHENN